MDLSVFLQDCVEELRLDPRMEEINLTFFPNNVTPVLVMADREKLRRVMMNIIGNSLKYMNKDQKEIKVELFDHEEVATVHIRDNGLGMDREELPHIFDRFYRADPSRNTESGGSGLGLAIVKQIVEGQDGRVWAESRAGEGTSIYFMLPRTDKVGE
ncbi:ATP-binding protein [Neobacillus sp. OS1-2]|uniref:sensor histidine kinase n=1 Tax=Neobacillus sp. OS1-2 TaxID=3070680 RepID=UPI0027E13C88|nr:ATP-binding protein [Neobacillus sp. OS1-2]WML38250.1 ATP-binding protein [Neobacillus sp. OS1-2]